jgi:hypothetical protein
VVAPEPVEPVPPDPLDPVPVPLPLPPPEPLPGLGHDSETLSTESFVGSVIDDSGTPAGT